MLCFHYDSVVFMVLRSKSRLLRMLGKFSTTELHLIPNMQVVYIHGAPLAPKNEVHESRDAIQC